MFILFICPIIVILTGAVSFSTFYVIILLLIRHRIIMWYIPVSFSYLHAVGKLVVHPPTRIVSHSKDKLSWLLPAHSPFEKAVDTGPEIHSSPPTLAVYSVNHSLPLGSVDRDFRYTENETRRHYSSLSGTFRKH